jgi:hypothetical protein
MLDPYEKLANAVIIRAVKDYRMMSGTAETNPEKQEIIDWILSRDFSAITNLDPHVLVAWLKEEEKK